MHHLTYTNTDISNLKNYHYVVERYIASLKQLTVVAYPIDVGKPVFITFRSVKYMKIITNWENSPFLLSDIKDCRALMEDIGLKFTNDCNLYYAQLEGTRMDIICGLVVVSDSLPT
jgi:hypothetical protein